MAGDFLARNIFMEQDTRPRVAAFPRIIERAVGFAGKIDAVADEFIDDRPRRADYDIAGFTPVFLVAGFECIFHETVVIVLVVKDADAPLG